MPPTSSAFDLYFAPNTLPILTPIAERTNVVTPIIETAGTISTSRKANVTPTASASILVATARASIVRGEKESLRFSSSFLTASRIIFAPISASSTNAIQWSMFLIRLSNCLPSSHPITGISA